MRFSSACALALSPWLALGLVVLGPSLGPSLVPAAWAADYRFSVLLNDPTTVIRTDRDTGVTTICRNTGHAIWCPPDPKTCQALLDRVQAWQAEREMPSQQQVIDCIQHNRCSAPPPSHPPPPPAGTDEAAVSWCLAHQNDAAPPAASGK